ncbi:MULTISPECIES: MFS transporter [unclassified Polynucleobacter]|uniref:MFS transporter n=1 Tax=unclassified Polynucleobacter TaxID=2640945 RepID=UPI0008CDC996|nr:MULTISPECIES: MFS transporter [unclassified Polynucleobacter]OHC10937.1 MAG: MFS transporter [Polynucleobacter sp. GWA2_45_21]HBK44478.1 MFS transporter [Polynucleobacter sp.]
MSHSKIVAYMNIAHFIDHYAMLIFAAAVIVIAPTFGMTYGELLPYATPGFIAFGAGSLFSGWLGDKWSRRNMMAIFFVGMGLVLAGISFVQTPLQLGAMLLAVGIVASIYHPVGTAMLVSNVDKLGKEMGINGMWGNVGVASSALVTGVINEYFGWRAAFWVPGIACLVIGYLFMRAVPKSADGISKNSAAGTARVPKSVMAWVIASLIITIIASSITFNSVTVALPKIFQERLSNLTSNTAALGTITFFVYLFGALAQFIIGHLLDKHSLKNVFLPLALVIVPALFFASTMTDYGLIVLAIVIIAAVFGQVTVNDTMLGKYTIDEWRGRAYSARYFLGFTAAGLSVGLVSILYNQGGFDLMLKSIAALSLFTVLGAVIFPQEKRV